MWKKKNFLCVERTPAPHSTLKERKKKMLVHVLHATLSSARRTHAQNRAMFEKEKRINRIAAETHTLVYCIQTTHTHTRKQLEHFSIWIYEVLIDLNWKYFQLCIYSLYIMCTLYNNIYIIYHIHMTVYQHQQQHSSQ